MGFGDFLKNLGTGLVSVIPGVGGAIQGNAANKAEIEQRRLDNAFMQQSDAAKKALIDRLTAAGYDPFGPQRSSQTGGGASQGSSQSRGGFDRFSRNETLAGYGDMEGRIKALVEGRLGQSAAVGPAEQAARIRSINQAFGGAQAAIGNLAGRGASAAQLGAAGSPMQIARAGGIADYLGSLPGEERNRRNQDLSLAQSVMQQFGQGQRQTGTDWNNMTQNQNFSNFGSSIGSPDVSALMALTQPSGPQQTLRTGYNPWAAAGADIGGAGLQYLLSRQNRDQKNG